MRRFPKVKPDPLRDGYALVATGWCVAIALGLIDGAIDARGWWGSPLPNVYVNRDYTTGYGFYFSPVAAFVFYPLTLLPWTVFAALWTAVMFVCLYWLAGRWSFAFLFLPPVLWELQLANIVLPLGVVAVAGLRHPALWSFALLTKITPGIGVVWFAVRREWRSLAIALGTTVAGALVTFVVAPGLWSDWIALLASNIDVRPAAVNDMPTLPLLVRLGLALGIVVWGALTNRRWAIPVAVTLATPNLASNAFSSLLGVFRIAREDGLRLNLSKLSRTRWAGYKNRTSDP
jgi:hypothetical protein